jgi:hypothetical protein
VGQIFNLFFKSYQPIINAFVCIHMIRHNSGQDIAYVRWGFLSGRVGSTPPARPRLRLPASFEEVDTGDKIQVLHQHGKIDGVEVFFTGKATGQIGFRFYRRIKFVAYRTTEPEPTIGGSGGDVEHARDQPINRDLVSQPIKFLPGDSGHIMPPVPAWCAD